MSITKVFDKALSVIDKNINHNHKEIAEKIYSETGYYDYAFNKFLAIITSGKLTLSEYIRNRRLYLAVCEMMSCPDKTLTDIAYEFGYAHPSVFTRAAKRTYGKTPAELKKSNQKIPDNRKSLENCLSDQSRLDSVIESITSEGKPIWQENSYFDTFIQATEDMGFDLSTCCIISELSEKLDIPFASLLNACFDMMIDYHGDPDYIPAKIECAIELGIKDSDELDSICKYYQCEYYKLNKQDVREYRKDHNH